MAVIPFGPSSRAAVMVRAITPALAAQYAESRAKPSFPAIEAILTMRPYLRFTICGASVRQHRNWLVRLVRSTRSHSSTG